MVNKRQHFLLSIADEKVDRVIEEHHFTFFVETDPKKLDSHAWSNYLKLVQCLFGIMEKKVGIKDIRQESLDILTSWDTV